MTKRVLLSITLTSLLLSNSLVAEENLDADLGGFETEEVASEELSELNGFGDEESEDLAGFGDNETSLEENTVTETPKESMFSLSGDLAFKSSAGYISHNVDGINYSGVNQAQTSLYLQLDAKLSQNWKVRISGDAYYDAIYDIHSNNDYNDDILDEYQTQLRFDDVYIQGRLTNDIDLKIGRQIVVWGKSDSIRITDVINPTDNRQPGMTDIEDLRLSVGMAKLDYYIGEWNLSAMLIGESRTFIEAPARSEFFPVDNIFPTAPNPFIELDKPNTSMSNLGYAFAANGIFSGWDLSFYAADVFDQKWFINPDTRKREVAKIKMIGTALNVATGSWLLKSEIAVLDGVRYNSTTDDKVRVDALVGFDYMGIKDTVLSLEIANRHIFEHEDSMSSYSSPKPDYVNENEVQTAMRATHSFLNDTLNATALVSIFGPTWEHGGFARIWAEYDVMDGVSANFGVVDYIYGDKPFTKAISDNDRVFADITYSF